MVVIPTTTRLVQACRFQTSFSRHFFYSTFNDIHLHTSRSSLSLPKGKKASFSIFQSPFFPEWKIRNNSSCCAAVTSPLLKLNSSSSRRVYKANRRQFSSEILRLSLNSLHKSDSSSSFLSSFSSFPFLGPPSCKRPASPLSNRPSTFYSSVILTQRTNMSSYSLIEKGTPNTMDYRIYFSGPNGLVSSFHDIPLHADASKTVFNMVVEIPRWTNHKMEICKEEKLNPIKQDVKKGKVRFVKNLFPHHGYIWNYGAFPQTWEDPNHTEPETNTKGDSDPIDVCEIGSKDPFNPFDLPPYVGGQGYNELHMLIGTLIEGILQNILKIHKRGAVVQVKVLGVMCLIDEGETDWKVLAIDVKDPLANDINDVEDIEKKMPGFLKATYEWFRYYKVPDGKPENQFAFNGEAKNKAYALKIVEETHKQWQNLMNKSVDAAGISCENTTVVGSPFKFALEEAKKIVENAPALGSPADLPSDVDQWHYISK